MKSEFYIKFIISALACALISGCSHSVSTAPYTIAIPVDDGNNHYTVQERQIYTVSDINAMGGSAAVFMAEGRFETSVDSTGQESIYDADNGSVPSAHFIKIGNTYHPSDFMSLSMATAMYHFENIKKFYDGFGATKTIPFPRQVLIDVKLERHRNSGDSQIINNASYVGGLDLFWINPYRDSNIPLTINGGVLAHEFLHNVFNYKLKAARAIHPDTDFLESLARVPSQLNEWFPSATLSGSNFWPDSKKASSSEKTIEEANSFLFASVNEGIADFMGYEYSHNAAWIVASLPKEGHRVLSVERPFLYSGDSQKQVFVKAMNPATHMEEQDPHNFGAYFSHFLWLVSTDPSWGDEATKVATLAFMENYAEFLATSVKKEFLSMGGLVKLFFKTQAPGPALCAKIQGAFPGELNSRSYACPVADPQYVEGTWR